MKVWKSREMSEFSQEERKKEYMKKYRETHKKQISRQHLKYYQDHIELILEYARKYHREHCQDPLVRERNNERRKKYYQEHREEILNQMKLFTYSHKEQMRKRRRKYYQKHREHILERYKKWEREHREQKNERCRRWRLKNRERLIEKRRKWRQEHREEVFEYQKKYREDHREQIKEDKRRYNERTRREHREHIRLTVLQSNKLNNGKAICGLNKRYYTGYCELSGKPQLTNLLYHHWNPEKPWLGIWVTQQYHMFVEVLDRPESHMLIDHYLKLKETIEEVFKHPETRREQDKGAYSNHNKYWDKRGRDYDRLHVLKSPRLNNGKSISGLNKRPYTGYCELSGKPQLRNLGYHHWDDSNPSMGIWLSSKYHMFAEVLDRPESKMLIDHYFKLKETIEEKYDVKTTLSIKY